MYQPTYQNLKGLYLNQHQIIHFKQQNYFKSHNFIHNQHRNNKKAQNNSISHIFYLNSIIKTKQHHKNNLALLKSDPADQNLIHHNLIHFHTGIT